MECQNIMLKNLKRVLILLFIIIMSVTLPTFATDVNVESSTDETTSTTEKLPYIEMQVKSKKVGESNQVLVECWASNLTNLEGLDIVFTYNNTILEPSYISGDTINEVLNNLESIKYDKKPTTSEGEAAFRTASTKLLKESFAFESDYTNVLGIDIFEYRAPNDNQEAMLFAVSRKDYLTEVSATDPVLIGTFSFRQKEGTTLSEGIFSTQRVKVICDDNPTAEDLSAYIRNEADGEDCTEIIDFKYQQYGSISGTIETGYYYQTQYINIGKNIANVKVYNASDVSSIDWTLVGNNYKNNRINIQPLASSYKKYSRPDSSQTPIIEPIFNITTTEQEEGKFEIKNIPYGEYVVVVDKLDYGDYIITNIIVNATNSDINLGNIQLEAGDLNKDGKIDRTDRTIFLGLIDNMENIKNDLGIVGFDLNDNGKYDKTDRTIMLRIIESSLGNTIKKVNNCI